MKLASGVLAYGKTQEAGPGAPRRAAGRGRGRRGRGGAARRERRAAGLHRIAPAEQVNADPDQLHRILANLLRNAREAIEHQEGRTQRPAASR